MNFKFFAYKNEWSFINKFFLLALIFSAVLLIGCGGGTPSTTLLKKESSQVAGSSSSENVETPSKQESPLPTVTLTPELLPKVSAGPRQLADPNVIVNLHGTASAAPGAEITSIIWTQISGPDVSIASRNELNSLLLMPDITTETQFEFRLTVFDSQGRTNSAITSITIKPAPMFLKVVGEVVAESAAFATFRIRLNAPATMPISVFYTTQDRSVTNDTDSGFAGKDVDYYFTSGEVIFAPGEIVKEIPVLLIDDDLDETDEVFNLKITSVNGAAANTNIGAVIIHDDDATLLEQSIQFDEQGPITIYADQTYINAINPLTVGTGEIIYSSSDESIASVSGLGFVTAVSVGIATITATKLGDGNYLPTSSSYILNIISRKPVPVIDMLGDLVTENKEFVTFKIYLNTPAATPISVFYTTEDSSSLDDSESGFARSNVDYQSTSGEVTFAPGEILKEISVLLINDDLVEADEVFNLKITSLNGATANTNTVVAVIRDDDIPLIAQAIEFDEAGPITIYADQTYTNAIKSSGAGTGDISYSSSDLSVASVNEQGVAAGISVGVTTITATKSADEFYLSTSTNYQLNIISRGTSPSVRIIVSDEINADGCSVKLGNSVQLTGLANDLESGQIPSRLDFNETELGANPAEVLRWSSSIDGELGEGDRFNTSSLSSGEHLITYSVTDNDGNTSTASVNITVVNDEGKSTYCPSVLRFYNSAMDAVPNNGELTETRYDLDTEQCALMCNERPDCIGVHAFTDANICRLYGLDSIWSTTNGPWLNVKMHMKKVQPRIIMVDAHVLTSPEGGNEGWTREYLDLVLAKATQHMNEGEVVFSLGVYDHVEDAELYDGRLQLPILQKFDDMTNEGRITVYVSAPNPIDSTEISKQGVTFALYSVISSRKNTFDEGDIEEAARIFLQEIGRGQGFVHSSETPEVANPPDGGGSFLSYPYATEWYWDNSANARQVWERFAVWATLHQKGIDTTLKGSDYNCTVGAALPRQGFFPAPSVPAPTPEECAARCSQSNNCVGFYSGTDNSQKCMLFDAASLGHDTEQGLSNIEMCWKK